MLVHIWLLTHLQFTAWPEMFSYPYLFNNGYSLYKDIVFPYQPLLVLILSVVFKVFGYKLLVAKIITWLIILFSDILIYLISLKIIGKKMLALFPVTLFVFLQPLLGGNELWFDLATTPFILLAILFFITFKKYQWFWLGLFLGLAFLIKQQIGIIFILISFYLLLSRQWGRLPGYILGIMLPAVPILILILWQNVFSEYLFWTMEVPLIWYPKFPGYTHLPDRLEVIEFTILFGPGIFWGLNKFKNSPELLKISFLIFLGLFVTAFPRFEFFRFQEALAAYFVLVIYLFNIKSARFSIVTGSIIFILMLFIGTNFGVQPSRFYGTVDYKLANEISIFTSKDGKVYLFGVHSLNYVLSERLPPKPWVDNYIWYMEIPGIQEKVLSGFEKERPKIIVWKSPQSGNWYDLETYQPQKIVDYVKKNYSKSKDLEGGVEIWQRN